MFENLFDPNTEHSMVYSDEEIIKRIAYFKWIDANCPTKNSMDFWIEAETEFRNINK